MGEQLPLDIALRDEATLDRFVAGDNAELLKLLNSLDPVQGQMVLIAGPTGSGKTHLLQAVARRHPDSIYLPLLDLPVLTAEVFEGLASRPLICLDDIHALAGDPGQELALFGLINEVRDLGHSLLFSTAHPLEQAAFDLRDLVSRLAACVRYSLEFPDDQHRKNFIQDDAARRGLELSEEVISWILTHMPRDMPSLTALMALLDRESLRSQRKVTIPFARQVLNRHHP